MSEERTYKITAYIPDAEIRGVQRIDESFTGSNGKEVHVSYLDLKIDDKNGDRFFLRDKCVENESKYHRGQVGTFEVLIDVKEGYRGKTIITVRSFKEGTNGIQ